MAPWRCLGSYAGPRQARAFVWYMVAMRERELHEESYRVYVTDSLQLMPQGKYRAARWAELVGTAAVERDDRTAEEIAAQVIESAGLEVR